LIEQTDTQVIIAICCSALSFFSSITDFHINNNNNKLLVSTVNLATMQQDQPFANTHQVAEPVRAASYDEPALDNTGRGSSMPVHDPIIPHSMGAKEAKSLHKTLDKEAKSEDKHIKSQIKDIEKVSA
jgi:hypothetical protein